MLAESGRPREKGRLRRGAWQLCSSDCSCACASCVPCNAAPDGGLQGGGGGSEGEEPACRGPNRQVAAQVDEGGCEEAPCGMAFCCIAERLRKRLMEGSQPASRQAVIVKAKGAGQRRRLLCQMHGRCATLLPTGLGGRFGGAARRHQNHGRRCACCVAAASGRARHGCLHALQHIFPSAGPLGLSLLTSSIPGLLTSSTPPFLLCRLPGGHAVQGDAAVPEAAVRAAQEPQPGPHAAGGAGHDCGALQGAQLPGGLRGARCGRRRCAVRAVVGVPRQQLGGGAQHAGVHGAGRSDVQTQVYDVPATPPHPLHRSTWVCRWATPPGPLV